MISLMRMIGLPDDHCCNAMALDANQQEIPFFYYSNPKERTGPASCPVRPSKGNPQWQPARVRLDADNLCG